MNVFISRKFAAISHALKIVLVSCACIVVASLGAQEGSGGGDESIGGMLGFDAGEEGKRLYRLKQYSDAQPYLQVAAEWGFKDAQARLGQIYFKGLGDVEKNPLRGLAWLGTAASKPSSTGFVGIYERALEQVTAANRDAVDRAVESYTKRFGSGNAAVTCKMRKPLGSNMSTLSCDYDDDFVHAGELGSAWPPHESSAFTL